MNLHSNVRNVPGSRSFGWFAVLVSIGLGLMAGSVNAQPFAYISNNNGTVTVIDTASNAVVGTVPVGDQPRGVGVNPNGPSVFVANLGSNNVSVIDIATDTVVATVPVGSVPTGVAVHPDGSRA